MQVKKFEARTMKEALEMVKTQLGPDAIILSARDNNKSFGLVGQGSVEITAAVSEETLQKKRFAESRLREQDRARLQQSSARVQKQVIDKMVNKYYQDQEAPKAITRTRYIDIDDELTMSAPESASARIKTAAQKAWTVMQVTGQFNEEMTSAGPAPAPRAQAQPSRAQANYAQIQDLVTQSSPTAAARPAAPPVQSVAEINALKGEIASLKQVIAQFQSVPQSMVSQHPGADYGLNFEVSFAFEKLVSSGISPEIAAEILTQAQTEMPAIKLKNKALVDGWMARKILNTTQVVTDRNPSKIQVFVGPAGAGKTATLVKLASHYVVREQKKVALVTTDNLKVGAADQMRIYAQILNVPFAIVRQKSDWDRVMAQLSHYDHILVDYPGLGLKNMDEISKVRSLLPNDSLKASVHLVLSCLAKDSDLTELGKRYKVTGFQDVIFTGLDESMQHGNIYNFMKRFETPLHSFGIGTRVPEDFEVATKERVLDLIFKITTMKKEQGS